MALYWTLLYFLASRILVQDTGRFDAYPDAVYTRSDGVSVAFEVVTNNYGQAELEAKEQAAEALGAEIELQRT